MNNLKTGEGNEKVILSKDAELIIENSRYQEDLKAAIEYTKEMMNVHNIVPTELQWTVLINHLNEMVIREREAGSIPDVDPEMFAEVSPEALEIAERVVKHVGKLSESEKYVLSIHFETAKMN